MTTSSVKIAPPNSLIFISDVDGGVVPDPDRIARTAGIVSTDSCVAVCCLAEMDGKTEITMGPAAEIKLSDNPAFDGMLSTPTRTLVVSTVDWQKLLEATVPTQQTRLRVWTNRRREPDKVSVGFG
jgi:hypothetical protein